MPDYVYAKHESRCPCCDEQIEVDDQITNIEGEWWHYQCALDEGVADE